MMKNSEAAGSVHGLHLVVADIDAAKAELDERGVRASEIFHFEDGTQMSGPDPDEATMARFSLQRPDGNSFMVQEVRGGR